RHPTQIYEALAYLIVFFLLFNIYFQTKEKIKEGKLLGLFLILVFGFRFFVEFLKENQSQFEEAMVLNMGQLLSIPLIIYGIYILNSKRDKTIKH
ncbi:MAG: prolipoprotein diacylglyceryl transferase family protein, partial [Bacteroidota bacterium]